ncbi:MAG TPA: aspartyl-phosphate phosphatase Spo0E family protein [Clostridiaceae bacterium]|nr:aspartyl-phosphate phosphatase Spo0E family protein [Clostridiaceae bacterium]
MKKKPIAVEPNKELSILSRIEESRKKIHDMINLNKCILFSDETVKMSQYLDKLIVEYIKGSEGEQSSEK